MFAKLALKNIKRSIKDYAIYFFTLVLGVAIFYVFNALDSQAIMLDVSDRVREMMNLVNVIMRIVSVFVAFILGALIIYASRFLIKRRSKEFGIYLTLGMSKRKISLILLLETVLIGILSLAVGLLLGIVASQFTSMLVANMFDANMTNFHFVFSSSALVQTLIYFGIIYIVVMIFNTIVISRQKLINLLSSNRRNEKIKLKNPWVCTIVFIVAAIILGWAYYLVTDGISFISEFNDASGLLIPIGMGVVSTFLLFWSLSGLLLRIFMSMKKVYYNKLNSFVLRQFSSKINTTVASMTVICLMLFFTICILGSALSISSSLHESIEKRLPADVQITSIGRNALDIEEIYRRENVNLNDLIKDRVTYRNYLIDDISVGDTLGSAFAEVGENGAVYGMDVDGSFSFTEEFISQSDYNRAAELFDLPTVNLADNEYAIIADYQQIIGLRNRALAQGTTINVLGHTLSPQSDKCIEGTIKLGTGNVNQGLIIVPDAILKDASSAYVREYILANYADADRAEEIERKLDSISNRFYSENGDYDESPDQEIYYYDVDTKQSIIDNSVGTSAMVTFIGLYLGIIFLISSAAILALKELSESNDNRNKYSILRKIGASESMLHRALFWQIFIFFLFPLLLAVLHAVFGFKFCNLILGTLGGVNIMQALPGVALLLAIIYGGYFIITYLCSKNIIRERRK